MLTDHETAAQKLDVELDYSQLVELAHQYKRDGGPAVGAAIELLAAFRQQFNDPEHGDDADLFWQLRDMRPSHVKTLLLLVDSVHCQLAEILQAWAQDGPYEDAVGSALEAHLEASTRVCDAARRLQVRQR